MVAGTLVWEFRSRCSVGVCFGCRLFIYLLIAGQWVVCLLSWRRFFYSRSGWCSRVIGLVVSGNVISPILLSLFHIWCCVRISSIFRFTLFHWRCQSVDFERVWVNSNLHALGRFYLWNSIHRVTGLTCFWIGRHQEEGFARGVGGWEVNLYVDFDHTYTFFGVFLVNR